MCGQWPLDRVRINARGPSAGSPRTPGPSTALNRAVGNGCVSTASLCAATLCRHSTTACRQVYRPRRGSTSALRRLDRALVELNVEGLATTKPLHQALVSLPYVQAGRFHTAMVERGLASHTAGLAAQRLRWLCRPLLPPTPQNIPPRQHRMPASHANSIFPSSGDEHIFVRGG